jgi:hypothetical protein
MHHMAQHQMPMTQEVWLSRYIAAAFSDVSLEDGIDIYAAESLDDYGNPEEDQRSLTVDRQDWRSVPHEELFPRFSAITFLDAKGFRFYTPAIMTALLLPHDPGECLSSWFLFNLKITKDGAIKGMQFNELFSQRQRAALIRFLKYVIYNRPKIFNADDAVRRLSEIQAQA